MDNSVISSFINIIKLCQNETSISNILKHFNYQKSLCETAIKKLNLTAENPKKCLDFLRQHDYEQTLFDLLAPCLTLEELKNCIENTCFKPHILNFSINFLKGDPYELIQILKRTPIESNNSDYDITLKSKIHESAYQWLTSDQIIEDLLRNKIPSLIEFAVSKRYLNFSNKKDREISTIVRNFNFNLHICLLALDHLHSENSIVEICLEMQDRADLATQEKIINKITKILESKKKGDKNASWSRRFFRNL